MDEIRDPQYKSPDGSALRVWRDAAKNAYLSEREGRPVFDEVVFIEVISPGSRDSTPVFECLRTFAPEAGIDKPRQGPKYAEYKPFIEEFLKDEATDASLTGTPLSQWSEMTRTMVASLKSQNIFSVEALASLPDTKLIAVGPDGRTWREKAKAYIETAKGSAYATSLAADLENERISKVALQGQVDQLAAEVNRLSNELAGAGKAAEKPKAAAKVTPPEPTPAPVADPLAQAPTLAEQVAANTPII